LKNQVWYPLWRPGHQILWQTLQNRNFEERRRRFWRHCEIFVAKYCEFFVAKYCEFFVANIAKFSLQNIAKFSLQLWREKKTISKKKTISRVSAKFQSGKTKSHCENSRYFALHNFVAQFYEISHHTISLHNFTKFRITQFRYTIWRNFPITKSEERRRRLEEINSGKRNQFWRNQFQ